MWLTTFFVVTTKNLWYHKICGQPQNFVVTFYHKIFVVFLRSAGARTTGLTVEFRAGPIHPAHLPDCRHQVFDWHWMRALELLPLLFHLG